MEKVDLLNGQNLILRSDAMTSRSKLAAAEESVKRKKEKFEKLKKKLEAEKAEIVKSAAVQMKANSEELGELIYNSRMTLDGAGLSLPPAPALPHSLAMVVGGSVQQTPLNQLGAAREKPQQHRSSGGGCYGRVTDGYKALRGTPHMISPEAVVRDIYAQQQQRQVATSQTPSFRQARPSASTRPAATLAFVPKQQQQQEIQGDGK
jgi:hypothetical protein